MPYCRRCGTQLEENARFCHRCGTPVDPSVPSVQPAPAPTYQPYSAYQQAPPPPQAEAKLHRPMYKEPIIVGAVALVIILITAVVIGAFMIAPLNPWSTTETLSDQNQSVKSLNLNFDTNIGDVNIIPLKIGERNILISVVANGSKSSIGSTSGPMTVTFDNRTAGNTLIVNSQVKIDDAYLVGANVGIQIYVDPALALELNVSSTTGDVTFSTDKNLMIQSLNLQTTTGDVSANLENSTVAGDISLRVTSLGNVDCRMNQNSVEGNCTLTTHATTGNVNLELSETTPFPGNLQVNAETVTGNIYFDLIIDGSVASKINSETGTFGDIKTNLNNFQGNDASLQTMNYPSACNIEVNNSVTTGNIYIDANYKTALLSN